MNGVTSQPQSGWSETSRANELSFSIIVSSKFYLFKRCALPNSSNYIASPVIACWCCFVCSGQRGASSVQNSCMNCERVKLPPITSNWPEAISCQHHIVINWKENETEWFNCGPGTDADSELNVNKTFNDKFHLASWVWPVAGNRDAYMMMLRHSAILERKGLQS